MLSATEWRKNQENTILFVLVDDSATEVTGLDDAFDVFISKAGGSFAAGTGFKWEVGLGWYGYTATADEADTSGPVAVAVSAVGIVQQNLEYVVEDRVITAVEFTYTVTSTAGNVPLPGVEVRIFADALATQIVWAGTTDAVGVARDFYGYKPRLEPGTYYFFRDKSGYSFSDPDVETVS